MICKGKPKYKYNVEENLVNQPNASSALIYQYVSHKKTINKALMAVYIF